MVIYVSRMYYMYVHVRTCLLLDLQREPVFLEDGLSVVSPEDKLSLEQDLYLLRMKILHFVNGFHEYIMTTVSYVGK